MNLALNDDQRKSLLITTALFLLLLLAMFLIKFATSERIQELAGGGGGGLTVNFGDSETGMGEDISSRELNVRDRAVVKPAPPQPSEQLVTSSNDEAVAVKSNPVKAPVKTVVAKPVPEAPKVSKSTDDALANILKGNNKGGDGDDRTAGNKGRPDGTISSGSYEGTGGTGGGRGGGNGPGDGPGDGPGSGPGSGGGSGGGYSLGNRKALYKPVPSYNCNETGIVVVEVRVDQNGRTISATPGIKGTTNAARCLTDQARIAAMNTKWQADPQAPNQQVGKITYTFSLN